MRSILSFIPTNIKSPILIYFIGSVIFFNRKTLMELIFSDMPSSEKLQYFEDHTTIHTLLTLPLLIAVAIVLSLPWLSYLFSLVTSKAHAKQELLKRNIEDKIEQKKELQELQKLELEERRLVDFAKKEDEIQALENDEVRERLLKDLNELRNNRK